MTSPVQDKPKARLGQALPVSLANFQASNQLGLRPGRTREMESICLAPDLTLLPPLSLSTRITHQAAAQAQYLQGCVNHWEAHGRDVQRIGVRPLVSVLGPLESAEKADHHAERATAAETSVRLWETTAKHQLDTMET